MAAALPGSRLCITCGRQFGNAGAFARHERSVHGVVDEEVARRKKRHRYTLAQKANALTMLFLYLTIRCVGCNVLVPQGAEVEWECARCGSVECKRKCKYQKEVAAMLGVPSSCLSKWKNKAEETLEDYILKRYSKKSKSFNSNKKAKYTDIEDRLYFDFVYRRKYDGLPTDGYWIR